VSLHQIQSWDSISTIIDLDSNSPRSSLTLNLMDPRQRWRAPHSHSAGNPVAMPAYTMSDQLHGSLHTTDKGSPFDSNNQNWTTWRENLFSLVPLRRARVVWRTLIEHSSKSIGTRRSVCQNGQVGSGSSRKVGTHTSTSRIGRIADRACYRPFEI